MTYDTCSDQGYLRDIDGNMKAGMVFDLSQWGNSYDTMKWLDGETGCTGDCNLDATETKYSDFEIGDIPSEQVSEWLNKKKELKMISSAVRKHHSLRLFSSLFFFHSVSLTFILVSPLRNEIKCQVISSLSILWYCSQSVWLTLWRTILW